MCFNPVIPGRSEKVILQASRYPSAKKRIYEVKFSVFSVVGKNYTSGEDASEKQKSDVKGKYHDLNSNAVIFDGTGTTEGGILDDPLKF